MELNGDYSNEFEAAFALSRREASYPRQQHLVDAHVAAGKHVLVFQAARYCGFTDALMGCSTEVISVHDTREEALAAYELVKIPDDEGADLFYRVASPFVAATPSEAVNDLNEDDIPF